MKSLQSKQTIIAILALVRKSNLWQSIRCTTGGVTSGDRLLSLDPYLGCGLGVVNNQKRFSRTVCRDWRGNRTRFNDSVFEVLRGSVFHRLFQFTYGKCRHRPMVEFTEALVVFKAQ